jgi:DNA-binding NarL/FixJ family response regulator
MESGERLIRKKNRRAEGPPTGMKAAKTIRRFDSAALTEPHELLNGLFNVSTFGFGILDRQFRYRAVNRALAAMNGVAPKAHLGKTARDVIGEAAVTLEAPFRHVFLSGREVSLEFWAKLRKKDEASYWSVDYFPIKNAAGRVTLVGGIVVENACQKKVQQLLYSVSDKSIRNLVLTAHDSDALLQRIMERSVGDALDSRTHRDRSAAMGSANQMPFVSHQSVEEALPSSPEEGANPTAHAVALTAREWDVLKLLVEGTGNKETAARLGITVKTVESHRGRIMLKLGLHSTRELVHYAIHNKMLNRVG